MTSMHDMKNEMLAMVLTDLAAICNKIADNSAVPKHLQGRAREFVAEFKSLLPTAGKGTASQHVQGEELLIKIARFLPRVLEVKADPAVPRN